MRKFGYTYILSNKPRGTIYIGVTSDLIRRVYEHRTEVDRSAFTSRYGIKKLVHFEEYQAVPDAIAREKQLKMWRRAWKIALIEQDNPDWDDLFPSIASP